MDVHTHVEEFVHGIKIKLRALPEDSETYIDDMFNATEILTTGTELAASKNLGTFQCKDHEMLSY